MQFHPAANLFPLMDDEELQALAEDIKGPNGQLEDILTYDNQIIDGRNRYRACLLAGVKPRFREWDGEGSLVAFVVGKNLHRRHLTPSQLAMVAKDMLPMLEAEAKERMSKGGEMAGRGRPLDSQQGRAKRPTPIQSEESESCDTPSSDERATDVAAKVVGTSGRQVRRAKKLDKEAPALAAEVREGKKTIGAAMREAGISDTKPKAEQAKSKTKTKREKSKANATGNVVTEAMKAITAVINAVRRANKLTEGMREETVMRLNMAKEIVKESRNMV